MTTATPSRTLTPVPVPDEVLHDLTGDGTTPSAAVRRFAQDLRSTTDWSRIGAVIADGLPTARADGERALLRLSSAMGPLLPQDSAGNLLREVRYRGMSISGDATGRYSDSKDGGDLHTDGPHRPQQPPAAFALLCIRQAAAGGDLLLLSISDIVDALDPAVVAVLEQPFLFDQREEGTTPVRRPVLTRTFDGWQMAYLRGYIDAGHRHPAGVPQTAAQTAALDALDAVIERLAADDHGHWAATLQPGQLVVVDNRGVIHGRTPFTADSSDRLMLRTWIGDRLPVE